MNITLNFASTTAGTQSFHLYRLIMPLVEGLSTGYLSGVSYSNFALAQLLLYMDLEYDFQGS